MTRPLDLTTLAALRRGIPSAVRTEGRKAYLGKVDGTLAVTLPDGTTDDRRVYVRTSSGTGGTTEAVAWANGIPRIPNLPVRVANLHNDPWVIGPDSDATDVFLEGRALLEAHAWQHSRFGPDSLYLSGLQFLPLAVLPTSPPSLSVTVYGGWYRYQGTWNKWETDDVDLTSYVPAGAGVTHFVIVTLDRVNNALVVVDGSDISGDAYTAGTVAASDIKAVTVADAYYPLAVVELVKGQTEIKPQSIDEDLRLWGGELELLHPLVADSATTLTISAGAVTATTDYHIIAAESGTTDDLDTITAASDRQLLLIQADSGDTITVKHGTGNINLNGAADFALSGDKSLLLFYDGTNWSDTGAGGGSGGTDSDAIHDNVAGEINAITEKATPVNADLVIIEDSADSYNKKKAQLGNLPGGGGTGDSSYTAVYTSRPAASNDGDLFLPSDGFVIERDTGAAWVPWGPLFPFTAVPTSGWSWVNQGTATVTTTYGGILLEDVATASLNLRMYVRTAPATPYVITAVFIPHLTNNVTNEVGLIWNQSSTNASVRFRLAPTNSWYITKASAPTTDVANYTSGSPLPVGNPYFFRIEDNGTSRICHYSWDGQWWRQVHSVGRTDYITADQVGIFVAPRSASHPVAMTLLSWEEA